MAGLPFNPKTRSRSSSSSAVLPPSTTRNNDAPRQSPAFDDTLISRLRSSTISVLELSKTHPEVQGESGNPKNTSEKEEDVQPSRARANSSRFSYLRQGSDMGKGVQDEDTSTRTHLKGVSYNQVVAVKQKRNGLWDARMLEEELKALQLCLGCSQMQNAQRRGSRDSGSSGNSDNQNGTAAESSLRAEARGSSSATDVRKTVDNYNLLARTSPGRS